MAQWFSIEASVSPTTIVNYYFSVNNDAITGFYNYTNMGQNVLAPTHLPYPLDQSPVGSLPGDNVFFASTSQFSQNGVNFVDTALQTVMGSNTPWFNFYFPYYPTGSCVMWCYDQNKSGTNTGDSYDMTTKYITIAPLSGPPSVSCFLATAPVLTPSGYRPIASLRVGDRVTTADGSSAIQRIKVQRCVASAATNPYRIPKGLYGAREELLISPNHHVLADGRLVEARHLGLKQKALKNNITYYNVELETWANMIVAGVTVESLAPVQRITVTMAEFKKMIEVRYGPMTAALEQKIKATCRFLADGRVELPAISTKNVTSRG